MRTSDRRKRIVTLLNLYALYNKTLMYVCMYVSAFLVELPTSDFVNSGRLHSLSQY